MKTQLSKIQLLIGLAAVLLLVAACAGKQPTQKGAGPATPAEEVSGEEEVASEPDTTKATKSTQITKVSGPATHTVEITASGFIPGTVTLKVGDTVEWTNLHTVDAWPASAIHPTHRAYPGSEFNKCNSVERNKIFDACERLQQGETWSFVFQQKGTWKYHDHLNPGHTGTAVVE